MKVNAKVLVDAVKRVRPAAATRGGSLPVLMGVRIESTGEYVVLTCTDLLLTLSTKLDVQCETGVVIAAVKPLLTALGLFGRDDVDVSFEDRQISGGEFVASLTSAGDPGDWPKAVTVADPEHEILLEEDAVDLLRRVDCARSHDGLRPILTGVCVGGREFAATDSYRVAAAYLDVDEGDLPDVLLSGDVLPFLPKAGDCLLRCDARNVSFVADDREVTGRLIEGAYPNWRRLFTEYAPKAQTSWTFNRAQLLAVLDRMAPMARADERRYVRFSSEGETVRVALREDVVSATLTPVRSRGCPPAVALNPEFLRSGVRAVYGDTVTIRVADPIKPVLLGDERDGLTYLLMPVRTS